MSKVKNIFFGATTVVIFFALLEAISRIFIFSGSCDFVERCIIEQGLSQRKFKGEYRILLYGESLMHGNHLYPKSTIDKWLKLYLENLLPEEISQNITVANFGRLGEDSEFISQAFLDTVPYRPDLVVFYTAHNDFIQLPNRKSCLAPKPLSEKAYKFLKMILKKSSFVTALKRVHIGAKIERHRKRDAALKKVDRWYAEAGQEPLDPATDLLHPDSREFNLIREKWENNVKKIVHAARRHDIPVIFLEGVSRWKGYRPFKSVHDSSLTQGALAEWDQRVRNAEDKFANKEYAEALELYKKIIESDPRYAMAYYRAGECYEKVKHHKKANLFYSLANDKDCFPIRAPSAVNQFYEGLREDGLPGVYIVNTQDLFEHNSQNGIIDDALILDQLHPTIRGQALIALEIVKVIYSNDLFVRKEQWQWGRLKTVEDLKRELGIDEDFLFDMYISSARYVGSYHDKAIECLTKALAVKPNSIAAKSQLAWIYHKKGDDEKAINLYKHLYREAPRMASEFLKSHPELAKEVLN